MLVLLCARCMGLSMRYFQGLLCRQFNSDLAVSTYAQVRWEGTLTPDTTVGGGTTAGGLFSIGLGKSRFSYKSPIGMGGRLFVDGKKIVDAWTPGRSTTSAPYNFVKGKSIKVYIHIYIIYKDLCCEFLQ